MIKKNENNSLCFMTFKLPVFVYRIIGEYCKNHCYGNSEDHSANCLYFVYTTSIDVNK